MTDKELRKLDCKILQKIFGIKKIYDEDYIYSGDHSICLDSPHYIPSGKPWRTHQIDALEVPHFSKNANHALLIVKKLGIEWDFSSLKNINTWSALVFDGKVAVRMQADNFPLAICATALEYFKKTQRS